LTKIRPKPEDLLQRVQEEERKERRGKLKIYLGAAPGVGKTFTMLTDAHAQRLHGLDVIVGVVETHSRKEIEALIKDLPILPRLTVDYHGNHLTEFDLDAAIKRNPGLILIDEMAHTNISGLRHAKRWQDIKELLDSGIDVYTTLNVQHVESLNDIVSQIIHTRVKETVPDSMLEMADTIELVDLPPEDLLRRLQEGKVYIPKQAELAAEHFFQKGNLIALRELALRVTAERVGEQVLSYRQGLGIRHIWPTREKILVCVGSSASSKLIRAAKRMAVKLQADWIAVHVDTPRISLSGEETRNVIENLSLAEKLGAETRIITGLDIVDEIMNFAREQNATLIMLWKHIRARWKDYIFGSLADELTRHSEEIDIYIVTTETEEEDSFHHLAEPETTTRQTSLKVYAIAIATMFITSLLNILLFSSIGTSNVLMIYLFGIAFVSLFGQIAPALLATVIGMISYNFFLTWPDYLVYPNSWQNAFSLLMMFIISQVISNIIIAAQYQVKRARLVQQDTVILHTLSRQLAGTRGVDKLLGIGVQYLGEVFNCETLVLIPEDDVLVIRAVYGMEAVLEPKEEAVAQWVFELGQSAGSGTDTLPFSEALYVPLLASQNTVGVLRLKPANERKFKHEEIHLLESCANQMAMALEADRFQEKVKKTELQITADQARLALLKSVSHDLRTPLVAVQGAASTLMEMSGELDKQHIHRLAKVILLELEQLSRMINNLLQMTYLEAESIKLQLQPHPLQNTIQTVIQSFHVKKREINLEIPANIPLVSYDDDLIQDVLNNLIDNALKFTPAKTPIDISVVVEANRVVVSVADRGPGIVFDEVNKLFEKYYRGRMLTTERGLGLGLAICYSIIKAHGGEIWAENRSGGGAVFRFTLQV